MPVLHIVGVDPGLVHTGCVRLVIDTDDKSIDVSHSVISGYDAKRVAAWIYADEWTDSTPHVFVEKYAPRSNFDTDERMVTGELGLRRSIPDAILLRNMGIKTIVTPKILQVLGLTKFRTASHHQDLLSAARIAVLGMMKNTELNRALSDIVRDHIDGRVWPVMDLGDTHA